MTGKNSLPILGSSDRQKGSSYQYINQYQSGQTVRNYAAAAAIYCHRFNLARKGSIDEISAGVEAYIKVMGKHHHVFFFISSKSLKIAAYHVADTRETLSAIS